MHSPSQPASASLTRQEKKHLQHIHLRADVERNHGQVGREPFKKNVAKDKSVNAGTGLESVKSAGGPFSPGH